jgi:hypothetical protein
VNVNSLYVLMQMLLRRIEARAIPPHASPCVDLVPMAFRQFRSRKVNRLEMMLQVPFRGKFRITAVPSTLP